MIAVTSQIIQITSNGTFKLILYPNESITTLKKCFTFKKSFYLKLKIF